MPTPSVLLRTADCDATSVRNCAEAAAKAGAREGVLRRSNAPRGVVASCGRLSHRKLRAPAAASLLMSAPREGASALSVAASWAGVSPGVSTAWYRSLAPPQKT